MVKYKYFDNAWGYVEHSQENKEYKIDAFAILGC